VGDSFSGTLQTVGDDDWVAVQLEAGTSYEINLFGAGAGALFDPYLRLYDANGVQVAFNDDGGSGYNCRITYSPTTTETYFISARSYGDSGAGSYQVTVGETTAGGVVGSLDELAAYLTDGYWTDNGGTRHVFDTSISNVITVNISALSADGQRLARWAMEAWERVADISFSEVTGPAQIAFSDNQPGAYSSYYSIGGITQSAIVNVSTSWLASYGTQIDDYSFSTYLHEIGHALGLGHQGDYNGAATYGVDETFVNDSYQVSLMSYFSQTENTFVNASYGQPVTAMIADIIAIQNLYGAPGDGSSTAGDTVYGVGQTIGGYLGILFDAQSSGQDPNDYYGSQPVALTLYDYSGTDTVNLSTDTASQSVDLNAEGIWNVRGLIGNVVVARGTVIENYIAGSGNDTVLGNSVANRISGNTGNDALSGAGGADSLFGGDGSDTLDGDGGNDLLHGETEDSIYDPVAAQVFRLYQATLDRVPDAAGHSGWTAQLLSGATTLQQVATGFVNSPEFQATYGATTNRQFVTLLYNNVLDRAPDAGGLAGWINQLDSGAMTRAEVVIGFSESPEFRANTQAGTLNFSRAGYQADWSDDVYRLYQATLDRSPDAGGFDGWTEALAAGADYLSVVSGFVNSPEFQATYGATTNSQFVTLLYNNVLDRAPDAGGLASWVNQLDSGAMTRAEVVRGFAQSPEFRSNSADPLEAWMRGQGGDRLAGGAGDNILFGGIGADTFVFNTSDGGTQTIADMEAWDTVQIENSSYASANALIAALTQVGDDVLLTDNGTTIQFENTILSEFDTDMFAIV